MSEGGFLTISGGAIKAAEEAAENKMKVPETARTGRDKEVRFWEEAGTITAAYSKKYTDTKTNTEVRVLTYEVACSADGSGENVGFVIKNGLRFAPSAMAMGEPQNLAKMSFLSVNKLVGLLRALGFQGDQPDGGYSQEMLAALFPAEDAFGEMSALVNRTLRFEVRQAPTVGNDGQKRFFPEISKVFEVV